MADPVVHITNGIPDLGTGNITTLGLTIAAQAATTTGQQGPLVQGAATTAAPTYTTGTVNPLSLDLSGNLRTTITNTSIAVTGTFWQATQPVSGTVTANQGTAGSAWPVTLTSTTITGTVAVTQSGTWNINNISGTISLPTGAATSANQPTNAAAASTTSGQTGNLAMGAVTTGAPSYTTATSNWLSLTTAGALRTDASATTQPVSGTFWQATQPVSIAAHVTVDQGTAGSAWPVTLTSTTITGTVAVTQSGNWTNRIVGNAGGIMDAAQNAAAPANELVVGGVYNSVAPTITSGNASQLQLDANGNLNVNIKAGAGSGGTAIADEAAFTAGTTQFTPTGGFYQTTATSNALTTGQAGWWQMTANRAGFVNLRNASGTEIGTATTPIRNAPDGTIWTLTGTSANINVTNSSIAVTGTFWQATQPVSGTVTANQGGTWTVQPGNTANTTAWLVTGTGGTFPITAASLPLPSGAATAANQTNIQGVIGAATAPASMSVVGGVFNTTKPTLTTGQSAAAQMNASGSLLVDGSAVTQPVSGTFWQATQPVSGTVTANQGGAPWSENITQFGGTNLSTGTGAGGAGIPRVTVSNDSNVLATQSGTWNITNVSGTVSLPTGAATSANQPTNAAQGSTTSGQTGGLALAAVVGGTSSYTTAQSQPLNMDLAGNLKVNTIDPATYNAGTAWTSATGLNTTASILATTTITYETIIGQITQTTTITGGAITFEESFDNGTTWIAIPPQRFVDPTTYAGLANPYTCVASTNQRFHIIPSGTGQIRARLSTVIAGTGSVTVGWTLSPISAVDLTNNICAGDTAQGVTDQGWPVKIGGVAKTTNPTAWTDGQRVNATFDKQGKLVAVGAIRQLKGVQKTSITVATETIVVTAGAAGVFNDVYAIVVTNKSATSVFVDFRDATAGTVRMTLAAPANDTRGFTVAVDSAMVQAVAANNWTATVSSAVTSIEISMLYVSNL